MSGKECEANDGEKSSSVFRRLCVGLLVFNFILLLTVLLVWAILRPQKPRFVLQDVTVYGLNASVPNLLTTNIHLTISSRNPNDKIGVYYDKLDIYAAYNNQQITFRYSISPSYQGHKDADVWSPFISGINVPIAPYNSIALNNDQSGGAVLLVIRIDGRVRWKVGTFMSGRYRLFVKCPAYITFGARRTGITVNGHAVKYQMVQKCTVTV